MPASYPDERWRGAKSHDIAWLDGEWCYQGDASGRVAFHVEGNLIRQKRGTTTELNPVYVSQRGLFRVVGSEGSTFIHKGRYESILTGGRYLNDDGSPRPGKKYQALHCDKCKLTPLGNGGSTFECRR